jgi:hypothetical protein
MEDDSPLSKLGASTYPARLGSMENGKQTERCFP